jgi:hypothetical protein
MRPPETGGGFCRSSLSCACTPRPTSGPAPWHVCVRALRSGNGFDGDSYTEGKTATPAPRGQSARIPAARLRREGVRTAVWLFGPLGLRAVDRWRL